MTAKKPGKSSWFANNHSSPQAATETQDADNNSTDFKVKNFFLENKTELKNNIFDLQVLTETITAADFEMLPEEEKEEIRLKILKQLHNFCSKLNTSKILGNRMLKLSIGVRYGWSGRGFFHEKGVFF